MCALYSSLAADESSRVDAALAGDWWSTRCSGPAKGSTFPTLDKVLLSCLFIVVFTSQALYRFSYE